MYIKYTTYLIGKRTGKCPLEKNGSLKISAAVGRLAGFGRRSLAIRFLAS